MDTNLIVNLVLKRFIFRREIKYFSSKTIWNTKSSLLKKHDKNKRETQISFNLAHKIAFRTHIAFKAQSVTEPHKAFDLLGCSPFFFRRWNIQEIHDFMTSDNYNFIWCIDHCPPVVSFTNLDEMYDEMFWMD